jgi:hypothetical protein
MLFRHGAQRRRAAPALGAFLAVLLAVGCTGDGAPAATRAVTGTCVFTFWLDDGPTATLPGCNGSTVATFGRTGAGGWTQVDSTSPTADGFSIRAPEGDYLLGVKYASFSYWEFFETASSQFDLGANVVGRPDSAAPSSQTVATFNLSGLDPWDANDYIELTSSGGATFKELVYPTGAASLPAGVTSGMVAFDWYGSLSRLPDGSRGDIVYLHQDATLSIPGSGLTYQSASRFAQLPATFVMANGMTQTVDVTLEQVPQTGSLSIDWRTSAFEQYRGDIHPNAGGLAHWLLVDGTPQRLTDKPILQPGTPDLLLMEISPGSPDQNLVDVRYGQFLPESWIEYRAVYYVATLPVTAPGAASASGVGARIGRYDPLPSPSGPVLPLVTPPRTPRIAGVDAFQDPTAVGSTPTLSWSAPAIGAPTSYTIYIAQPMVGANGATVLRTIAYLTTGGTSMTIPTSVLQPGVAYVALITAYVKSPDTSDHAPYHVSYPYAFASAVVTFST